MLSDIFSMRRIKTLNIESSREIALTKKAIKSCEEHISWFTCLADRWLSTAYTDSQSQFDTCVPVPFPRDCIPSPKSYQLHFSQMLYRQTDRQTNRQTDRQMVLSDMHTIPFITLLVMFQLITPGCCSILTALALSPPTKQCSISLESSR